MARTDVTRLLRCSLMWAVIILIAGWSLFPFWWEFGDSFKPPAHLFDAMLLPLLQHQPTLEHWQVE